MPLNLVELLKADGKAGIAGQTFSQVTDAGAGIKMSDYRISAVSFTGQPVSDAGTYPSPSSFNIVATFTRGGLADNIQRNASSAWSFTPRTGPAFNSSITSFTANSGGASHSITLQISVPATGAKTVSPTVAHIGTAPSGTNPWPVQWAANIGVGTGGTASLHIEAQYDPDTANFNPVLTNLDINDNGWINIPFTRAQYTASDYEIEWHYGAGMARAEWTDPYDIDVAPAWTTGSRLGTGVTFGNATSMPLSTRPLVYPATDPEFTGATPSFGTRNDGSAGIGVIWMRWRGVGDSAWNYPVQPGYSAYPGRWIIEDPRADL